MAQAEARFDIPPAQAHVAKALVACPAWLTTLHATDWKQVQKDDPVLCAMVRHLKVPQHEFKKAMKDVTDEKSVRAYLKARDSLVMRDGLLYHKLKLSTTGETVWHFVVPKVHRGAALDGCHRDATHQGQRHSFSLMQEQFWWPGMARDIRHKVKHCVRCKKFKGASPIVRSSRSSLVVALVNSCT